jgi:hypothetical protein
MEPPVNREGRKKEMKRGERKKEKGRSCLILPGSHAIPLGATTS